VLLDGRYRLDDFVASGGMGSVWRATDTVLGRVVAVKIVLPALATDPDFAPRFRAEARILAALRHPNVVDVYDYGETSTPNGDAMYLVMAYVDGESLYHRIAAGPLPVEETLAVVAQAADALEAAHAGGIVHRDVKPGNLLIRPDGTVVLVDFGVARSAAVTAITSGDAVPGTALYMAPEQAAGQPISAAVDIYALGAVTYHCLTGHPPFTGDSPVEVAVRHLQDELPPLPPQTPPPVVALVKRAMEKQPDERIPTAAAFAASARAIASGAVPAEDGPTATAVGPAAPVPALAGNPVATGTPTASEVADGQEPAQPGDGSPRRRAVLVAAAAVLGLIVVSIVALFAFDGDGTKSPAEGPAASLTPVVAESTRPTNRGPSRPVSTSGSGAASASASAPALTPPPQASTAPADPGPSGEPTTEPEPTPAATTPAQTQPAQTQPARTQPTQTQPA
jgi:serine/threonine-protein kinase